MRNKVVLITLLVGIPAFFLGHLLWSPSPMMTPSATQLPFFMLLSVIEALVFGLGIAFIIFGWPFVSTNIKNNRQAFLVFLAVSWMLVSWWFHDNLHAHNGADLQGLLYIEYAFHLTLILASLILASTTFRLLKQKKIS